MIDIQTEIIGTQILEEEIKISPEKKFPKLLEIIDKSTGKILIFASTKRYVEILRERLEKENIRCCTIHSNITQRKREFALKDFQMGKIKVLIGTDVASRGLHIDDVEYVINYDSARSDEIHKHRIGRTGRMGKIGNAITFVEEGRRKRRRDRTDDYLPKHLRENKEGSERRPASREREGRSERPTGGRRFKSDYSGGERRSYSSEGSERRERPTGERRPYNRGGERKPYSSEGSERRSYNSENNERSPHRENRDRPTGERRSYSSEGSERKPYHSESSERKFYHSENKEYSSNREGRSERPRREYSDENRENRPRRFGSNEIVFGKDRKKDKPHRQFQNRDESDGERRGPKKPEGRFQSTRAKVRSRFSKFRKR